MYNKEFLKKTGEAKLKTPVTSFDCPRAKHSTEYYDADTGKLIAIVFTKFWKTEKLFSLLGKVKFPKNSRLSGMTSLSQVFGVSHREPVKNLATRRSMFNAKYPEAFHELRLLLQKIEGHVGNYPEILKKHEEYRDQVAEYWRFGSGLFSSGIINNNTKLLYHTDNGNAAGCYSYMLCVKRGVEGGNLHLPEYDIEVPLEDGDVVLFDGASVSHGVTPFRLANANSRRYTIVFYTNERIKKALPTLKEELDYMNKSITKTVLNRKKINA